MKVLQLCNKPPYPPVDGGSMGINFVTQGLLGKGAEVVLLGCTELSVIKRDFDVGPAILDVMEVLAYSSIAACGKHARNNPVIF